MHYLTAEKFVISSIKLIFMSVAEMKKKIHEQVDGLEESKLKLLNDFIEQINSESNTKVSVLAHAMEIIKEREKVLAKLAQ
jgi:ABC-type branched-subunit amino acid transport system ATPase component